MSKHKKIHEMVDKFLKERRMSEPGGGWAAVIDQDMEDLYKLVDMIIDAKCQLDCDGDQPIRVSLTNRRKEYMPCFSPVPYRGDGEEYAKRRYERVAFNLAVAYHDFETEQRIMEDRWHREEKEAKEK